MIEKNKKIKLKLNNFKKVTTKEEPGPHPL